MKKSLNFLVSILGFLLLWEILFQSKMVDPVLLPSPIQVIQALIKGFSNGDLETDFLITVRRTIISFILATTIAVPIGVFFGSSEIIYQRVEFLIDFFRSTPASALFPLFLVIFGTGEKTKIAVATFGAALAILFNVAYGVMNARKLRQLAAKVMGAPPIYILKDVTFLESMPQTFIGMRSGISIALVIVIVAEMFIGSSNGLGQKIINSQMVFDMPEMYAAIFAAGTLGYFLNLIFLLVEKKYVHWGGK
jgi:NitT/TauT family transport system permease protein